MRRDNAFVGQDVKFAIIAEATGFDMGRDDFTVTIRRGSVERTFQKSELVEEVTFIDGVEIKAYYIAFNTGPFGPGMYTCIVDGWVPDTDFETGYRHEIDKFNFLPVEPR